MNFYENLFKMILTFFSSHIYATTSSFPQAFYCGFTLQILGVHMTFCHL